MVSWGGSRSTKPCVFPCKVAAAGDERYLVCAAVAAGVVSVANCSSYVFCNNGCSCVRSSMHFLKLWRQIALEWLRDCCHLVLPSVDRCRYATGCCETQCNGCMNVAWAMFWGGSRSTKPCVFPCKVAAAGDERYLVCLLCVLQRVVVAVCVVLCAS